MFIGDRNTFSIEYHHDPVPKPAGNVFGRMCLWFGTVRLGDPIEAVTILNGPAEQLQRVLDRVDALHDTTIGALSPLEAFETIDSALYGNSDRSIEEIVEDANRFSPFDFLTNGGESFDGTTSFILPHANGFRILFRDETQRFHTADVPRSEFSLVIRTFLEWVSTERARAG